jgi:hypothetical protein
MIQRLQGRLHIIRTPTGDSRAISAHLIGQPFGGFVFVGQDSFYAVVFLHGGMLCFLQKYEDKQVVSE